MTHVVVDISGHGFGHAGQVIPVVRDLLVARPELAVTLRTAVPAQAVRRHLGRDVAIEMPPTDVGLVMHGPMDVDVEASADAYAALHAAFDTVVAQEAERLAARAPDLVLADVPYTSLAAAARAGVPAVALCSLNWLDAYRAYCAHRPEAAAVQEEMRAAYAAAELFIQPAPHTPMAELGNVRPVGPICRVGASRRAEIDRALGLTPGTRLLLTAFGGIGGRTLAALPELPDAVWLQPGVGDSGRADVRDPGPLGLDYCDLLASGDLVVTKSGYGTLTESLAVGTRVLMLARPPWPEEPAMRAWLERNGTAAVLDRQAADAPTLARTAEELLARPASPPVPPGGRREARDLLLDRLAARA